MNYRPGLRKCPEISILVSLYGLTEVLIEKGEKTIETTFMEPCKPTEKK